MNAYELQALRHIFAMTIDECATWIAQTGDSESWRQWENGKCAIPDRVVEQLLAMRQQRKKHLHAIIEKINNRIGNWICPYISRHLLSLNPLQARCRRYSRGER